MEKKHEWDGNWSVVRGWRDGEPMRPYVMADGLTRAEAEDYAELHGGGAERPADGAWITPNGQFMAAGPESAGPDEREIEQWVSWNW